ncbi:MAG: hypothetical protein KBC43_01455 [Bacteroidales bacterium]|jgi:hypothetical protein|nr:hypothetical protein [Bacteroidales bacterium]MDX9905090.1 hypothetical protein [Bacteroidales bacterium]
MKKFTFLAVLAVLFFTTDAIFAQDVKAKADEGSAVVITPEKFQDYASENIGGLVEIKGMVIHVCRHGGKKMFIIGEDPEMRVKINASDKVSVFEPEVEGSVVVVNGVIEPIEEEVVPDAEKATEDTDHKNYYHKPQYAISCNSFRIVEE